MSLAHCAIVRHHDGATSSTRDVFTAVLIALIALAFSGAALARHPTPLASPATIKVKPTRALPVAQQPDQHVLIQLTGQAAVAAYAAALPAPGVSTSSAGAVTAARNQIAANKAQQAILRADVQRQRRNRGP